MLLLALRARCMGMVAYSTWLWQKQVQSGTQPGLPIRSENWNWTCENLEGHTHYGTFTSTSTVCTLAMATDADVLNYLSVIR